MGGPWKVGLLAEITSQGALLDDAHKLRMGNVRAVLRVASAHISKPKYNSIAEPVILFVNVSVVFGEEACVGRVVDAGAAEQTIDGNQLRGTITGGMGQCGPPCAVVVL